MYYNATTTQSATVPIPAICNNQAKFAIGFRMIIPSGIPSGPTLPSYMVDNIALTGILNPTPPTCATYTTPANGATGVSQTTSLNWDKLGATGYNVYLDTINPQVNEVSVNQPGSTYNTTNLKSDKMYYWEVVPLNSAGSATGCSVSNFTTLILCTAPTLTAEANGITGLVSGMSEEEELYQQ